MKRNHNIWASRQGSALLTIIVIVLIGSALVATLASVTSSRSFMAKKLAERVKAEAIAEAGIGKAYSILAADFDQRTNAAAFPATPYAGGVYDVAVTAVGDDDASICSTGTYGSVTEVVILDVRLSGGAVAGPGPQEPWECAILSGGNMTWTGNGTTIVGSGGLVHANGSYKQTGSTVLEGNLSSCVQVWCTGTTVIDGDAEAPSYKGKAPGNVTGTATTGPVAAIPIPNIDLCPYYNHALANGEVHNGNLHISGSSDIEPTGGILWVNGDLRISSSGNMIGSFIATGDVTISGSGNQVKVEAYPAVVSRDGDIDISGNGQYHGLMYAKNGAFEKTGSGDTVGSIFCAGSFKKGGGWGVMAYEDSTPVAPGEGGEVTEGNVGVTAWQR